MTTPPLAGSVVRIGVALALCAACFQAGRWYQELAGPRPAHAKADAGNEMVYAKNRTEPAAKMIETAPLVAAGRPAGQSEDIITPLNVRDPSALVMGPGASMQECVPSAASIAPAEPPAKLVKPLKPLKLKKGRLIELLKKADKKGSLPNNY